jgi:S1/P1 Nuclease
VDERLSNSNARHHRHGRGHRGALHHRRHGVCRPGHRVVGRIAEIHLANSRALEEVRKILRPQETLADAAEWADTIKAPTYEDADTQPFRLAHPAHRWRIEQPANYDDMAKARVRVQLAKAGYRLLQP